MELKDKTHIIIPGAIILLGIFTNSFFLIIVGIFLLFAISKPQGKAQWYQYTEPIVAKFIDKFSGKGGSTGFKFNYKNNPNQKPMEIVKPYKKRRIGLWILLFVVIILFISFASSFWVVVGVGETGVRSFFGKVRDQEFHSGFHLKNPLETITKMSVRTQDYTMSVAQGEGNRSNADAISALTKEGLTVDLDITILYRLIEEKASDVYKEIGLTYDEVVIRPQIRSVIREVIAEYETKDIYSEKRAEAAKKIFEKLNTALEPRGIALEDVLLRHVELPANLSKSIQEKLQSEQEAQRYDFVLDVAKKEAERKRIEAEGQRDSQKIINESLSENYLNYLYIQSLKDRQGTIYVPTNSANGMPLFKGI